METLFTDLVGCTKPIQLAGMGPICSDELCAAVSEAGGLGMITARLTPQPVATYTEPVPPGNARSTALPQLFIRCTANPPTTPDVFGPFAATARAKGWEVREIATGHLAMLTAPRELAAMLHELAR